jgi:LacI family transcriptional regulator
MAIGALHSAYDRQVSVPAQLSVIGFDDITFAQYTQPALTTVAVPRPHIGKLAFEMLWSMMTRPQASGEKIEIPTHLMVRQSTAAPGARP